MFGWAREAGCNNLNVPMACRGGNQLRTIFLASCRLPPPGVWRPVFRSGDRSVCLWDIGLGAACPSRFPVLPFPTHLGCAGLPSLVWANHPENNSCSTTTTVLDFSNHGSQPLCAPNVAIRSDWVLFLLSALPHPRSACFAQSCRWFGFSYLYQLCRHRSDRVN